MNPALDPRPASRYPAVTLSHFRDRLDARPAVTEVPAAHIVGGYGVIGGGHPAHVTLGLEELAARTSRCRPSDPRPDLAVLRSPDRSNTPCRSSAATGAG